MIRRPPRSTRTDTLFPYTTLFRSNLYDPEEAARDIVRLRDLDAEHPRGVRLALKNLDGDDRLRLKVYSASGALALSDVVPALEHFGFEVLEEMPTALNYGRPASSNARSEERRVGKAGVSTCRSRWSPYT